MSNEQQPRRSRHSRTTSPTTYNARPVYKEGDRVRVDRETKTMPPLPSYNGVITEVVIFHAEQRIGYNIQIDGDPREARRWFFYEEQLERYTLMTATE